MGFSIGTTAFHDERLSTTYLADVIVQCLHTSTDDGSPLNPSCQPLSLPRSGRSIGIVQRPCFFGLALIGEHTFKHGFLNLSQTSAFDYSLEILLRDPPHSTLHGWFPASSCLKIGPVRVSVSDFG